MNNSQLEKLEKSFSYYYLVELDRGMKDILRVLTGNNTLNENEKLLKIEKIAKGLYPKIYDDTKG